MKKDKILIYIEENKEKLPLSFNDIEIKDFNDYKETYKAVSSEKYKDADYGILSFYKNITRF